MVQKRISVGIIQENPIVGDIEGNLNLAVSAIEDLSSTIRGVGSAGLCINS